MSKKEPASDLIVQAPLTIPLNIDPQNDTYVIKGGGGVAVAHVKKPTGEVFSVRVQANGAFRQFTVFDPSAITVAERRQLERNLYEQNMSQADIADLVGVSQATVSLDLKKIS